MRTRSARDGETEAMWEQYSQGATLREVGDRFGLTAEAIRMRLKKAGYQTRSVSESRALLRVEPVEQLAESLNLWYATLKNYHDIARQVGLPHHRVLMHIRANTTPEQRRNRNRRVLRKIQRSLYTEEEMLDALRTCGTFFGHTPGRRTYNEFAITHDLPSGEAMVYRFGSWNEAVIAAGFVPHAHPKNATVQAYSDADLESALRRVAIFMRRRPSMADYNRFRRPGEPKVGTFRKRYGGWVNALDAIL